MSTFKTFLSSGVALALIVCCTQAPAQEEQMEDPLGDISVDMQQVATKLSKFATDKPTQLTEQQVIAKLDALIKKLDEELNQMGSSGNRAGNRPSKPAADSIIRDGPGGMGELHAARQQGKPWGTLPPKERQRILQSLTDGFPPHYQEILERYYRRLADEKPLGEGDSDSSARPSTSSRPAGQTAPKPAKGNG